MPARHIALATIAALTQAALTHTQARATTVQVTVTNIHNNHGQVLVALCPRADFLRPHCPWQARAPASPGAVTLTIPNVPPGTYAAQAFHDENNNGRLDRTFFGLPREAMGFSNNAPLVFGPPSFATAAFPVSGAVTPISFALRYY